jgi:peptide/nickel transport system permease protein
VLPVITLAFTQTAMLVRFARSQSLDFVASDAFRTARAAGRNADAALATATRLVLSPVLALSALQLSTLLTGAVVVESVFALPGLGSMMVRDIANRDVTKVQSTLLVIVVAVFVIRLVIDAINDRLDPRRLA